MKQSNDRDALFCGAVMLFHSIFVIVCAIFLFCVAGVSRQFCYHIISEPVPQAFYILAVQSSDMLHRKILTYSATSGSFTLLRQAFTIITNQQACFYSCHFSCFEIGPIFTTLSRHNTQHMLMRTPQAIHEIYANTTEKPEQQTCYDRPVNFKAKVSILSIQL